MLLLGSLVLPARAGLQTGLHSQHVNISDGRRLGRAQSSRQSPQQHIISCEATFNNSVKVPASHISSSSKALQQLALSSGVNSALLWRLPSHVVLIYWFVNAVSS